MKKVNMKDNKKIKIIAIVAVVIIIAIVGLVFARPSTLGKATGNVNGASEELVTGTADYTEVCKYYNEALKLDLSEYTNTEDLEEALLNLDWTISSENQDDVDSQATAIKNGIKNLKKASDDTTTTTTTASSNDKNSNATTTTKKKSNSVFGWNGSSKSTKTTAKKTEDNSTTTTTTKKNVILNKIVDTSKVNKAENSGFKWWIIPIIVVGLGVIGFVVYRSKNKN